MFPAKWEHICRLLLPVQWQWEMDEDQKHACKKVIYLDEKLYFSIDKRYHLCLSVWPFSLCTFHVITDILGVSSNIPIYLSYCVFLIYPDYSVLFFSLLSCLYKLCNIFILPFVSSISTFVVLLGYHRD